jgi:hypothetical protein
MAHAADWAERPPATFYVDRNHPRASDDNGGTAEAPFRSIQAAADAVRPGDTVKIRPGRYREGVFVYTCGKFDNYKDRTWEARRVTFEADGGQVILDGSIRVPHDAWQPADGTKHVFVATVERPEMIMAGIHRIPPPEPKWCFAGEQMLMPNVSRQRGRNKSMRIPEDDHVNR